jgi:cytoskeletal protein CcmA (bactofilin family)
VGQTHTILGPEASFDGKLTFQGAVRIDGRFSGEIVTEDVLVIGEGGEVQATLQVGSLVLNGVLRGNVHAKRAIELHAPARLYGDIETPQLVIHAGVVFEGHCKMEGATKPELVRDDKRTTPPRSA